MTPIGYQKFRVGDGSVGKGVETALLGMKIGEKREVYVAKEFSRGLTITASSVEIEILEIH